MTKKEQAVKAYERHLVRSVKKFPCWTGFSPSANRWLKGDLRFDYVHELPSRLS